MERLTGTEKNPIHKLGMQHLLRLRDTTVYYEELSYTLNLYWAKDYCIENNIKLKRVNK